MTTQTEALNQAKQKIESAMKCHPNAVPHLLGEAWDFINEALAQPEQEPVAWRGYNWGHSPDDWVYRDFDDPILDGNGNNVGQPLYTAPQRKPLTDEQIEAIAQEHIAVGTRSFEEFARRIEAAHGIKE